VRNNLAYITASASINNLIPLLCIFIHIYAKNPFNFNFILLNHLIKDILTFIVPTTLIFAFKTALLPYN